MACELCQTYFEGFSKVIITNKRKYETGIQISCMFNVPVNADELSADQDTA